MSLLVLRFTIQSEKTRIITYLIPIMIMQTVGLKIQQLILSASSASHTAVTAFYPTIIPMIISAILPRSDRKLNSNS